jgi:hypothetical protein
MMKGAELFPGVGVPTDDGSREDSSIRRTAFGIGDARERRLRQRRKISNESIND